MINRVKSLTKIFIKDFYNKLNIFNIKNKSIEKSSILFWLCAIIALAVTSLSYKLINALVSIGQVQISLNIEFFLLAFILMFQISLMCVNMYFFSKDLEFILPLPVSSFELLVSKFFTLLFMVYMVEAIFGLIPLIMYGLLAHPSLMYFPTMLIILLLFPILYVSVISLITLLLMRVLRFIKNKNAIQIIITVILIFIVFSILEMSFDSISQYYDETTQELIEGVEVSSKDILTKMSNAFLVVNPSVDILKNNGGIINSCFNLIKLILYSLTSFVIFIFLGKNMYLDNILSESSKIRSKGISIERLKTNKKEIRINKKRVSISYLTKELRTLTRTPVFFMQTIFPVLIILITLIMIVNTVIPALDRTIQSDDTIREYFLNINLDAEMSCIILGLLQVLFSISKLSLTAISREGTDALAIKYIPIDLYKQFKLKNVIQVVLNIIVSIVVLGLIYYLIPNIGILNISLLFIISLFLNLLSSYSMLLVDIRRPILNWNTGYAVTKKNDNTVFQYAYLIIMILILMYVSTVLKEMDITKALIIEVGIFAGIFIILDRIIWKNCSKIFRKII